MTDTYTPPDALVERVQKAIHSKIQEATADIEEGGSLVEWQPEIAKAALAALPLGEIVLALRFYGEAWDGQEAKTMPWGEVQEAWSEPKESLLVDAGSEARRLRKQLEGGE